VGIRIKRTYLQQELLGNKKGECRHAISVFKFWAEGSAILRHWRIDGGYGTGDEYTAGFTLAGNNETVGVDFKPVLTGLTGLIIMSKNV
jgi:hypothetical protein